MPPKPNTKPDDEWCYATDRDGEVWKAVATREEAVLAATKVAKEHNLTSAKIGKTRWIEYSDLVPGLGEHISAFLENRAQELGGEFAEACPGMDKIECEHLESDVLVWLQRMLPEPSFFVVEDDETIYVPIVSSVKLEFNPPTPPGFISGAELMDRISKLELQQANSATTCEMYAVGRTITMIDAIFSKEADAEAYAEDTNRTRRSYGAYAPVVSVEKILILIQRRMNEGPIFYALVPPTPSEVTHLVRDGS